MTALVYAANAFHYGWSPHTKNTVDDILAWLTALSLIALYVWGYRFLQRSPRKSVANVLLPAVPLVIVSFLTIPYDSTDVFLYSDMGWAQAHYGMNPYSQVLRSIPGIENDPMIAKHWMNANKNPWLDLPFVYGFAFALMARFLAWLGGGNWWLTVGLFKIINVIAYASICALLWTMARYFDDSRPDRTLYLFAWSPLVLQHHIANAHNDLIVGCLLLFAVKLLLDSRGIWAPAVLLVATLVKYITLPIIPVFIWYIGKREGRYHAVLSIMIAMAMLSILSAPFIGDVSGFRFDLIASQIGKTTAGSLYSFVYYVCRFVAPGWNDAFGLMVRLLLWSGSAAIVGWKLFEFCRKAKPELQDVISVSTWILFLIVFVASSQFYSWYIGMLFPLTLVLRSEEWMRSLMILLSTTHVFSLTSLSRKGIGYFVVTSGAALWASRHVGRTTFISGDLSVSGNRR